ncbi:hypothetical protein Poly51_41830 [Rubripirellula tenax]|uniref:N-sulphoglucosamine sulphohydrolase C-terminal domain-containing protein n=2 Tax=Rubripirellula tenax TaxID=2528015 RepID=A0A5C6ERE7_9BACT|nr:hypothetical protein Poly51_41830 [Rubripirellula tenax]
MGGEGKKLANSPLAVNNLWVAPFGSAPFGSPPASEALVRKDWKYFYWPEFEREQLFDLKSDPIEENDLSSDPAFTSQLEGMRKRFAELKSAAK